MALRHTASCTYGNPLWTSTCCSIGWAAGRTAFLPLLSRWSRPQCHCRLGKTVQFCALCVHNSPAGRRDGEEERWWWYVTITGLQHWSTHGWVVHSQTHKYCFGLASYSYGFLRFDHKYNPHHPEALFLGILWRLFGEARHYYRRVCLRKQKIDVCVI